MARPEKYTVDYFPHICKQGKTMFILEARYGNNGYTFWFKLLELLASTRGHYFNIGDNIQKEFLGALTKFPVEDIDNILGLLSQIGAIDNDLWANHNVIWSQNLVDNVSDVYESRKGLLPQKPYYLDGKLYQNIDNMDRNPVNSLDNTQTKLNKTILNNKGIKNIKLSSETGKKVKEVFARIDEKRGYRPPKRQAEAVSIIRMLKTYTPDDIITAWSKLKEDKFWVDKELYMMSVESQIGAIVAEAKSKQRPSKLYREV